MSEQSTYSNDPNEQDGQEGVLDRVDDDAAGSVDVAGSEDIHADDPDPEALGTPASNDPNLMSDVSPDDLGGTGGPDAGGAG